MKLASGPPRLQLCCVGIFDQEGGIERLAQLAQRHVAALEEIELTSRLSAGSATSGFSTDTATASRVSRT